MRGWPNGSSLRYATPAATTRAAPPALNSPLPLFSAAAGGRRLGWVIGAQVDPVAVHACVAAGGRIVGELDETDRAFYRVITV